MSTCVGRRVKLRFARTAQMRAQLTSSWLLLKRWDISIETRKKILGLALDGPCSEQHINAKTMLPERFF